MGVSRFGVSLEEELLTALDQYVTENNFSNRSQAIRYLIEKNLVETKMEMRQPGCRRRGDGLRQPETRNPYPISRTSASVPRCGDWRAAI